MRLHAIRWKTRVFIHSRDHREFFYEFRPWLEEQYKTQVGTKTNAKGTRTEIYYAR
jgi:hypothetical protein